MTLDVGPKDPHRQRVGANDESRIISHRRSVIRRDAQLATTSSLEPLPTSMDPMFDSVVVHRQDAVMPCRAEEREAVYTHLRNAARRRGRVFYAELAGLLNDLTDHPDHVASVSDVLREIAEAEHQAGRPLLTALAVTGKSVPGDVFFTSARDLGVLTSADPAEEMGFWLEEERRVHEAWASPA
jgi:hypothetical protein